MRIISVAMVVIMVTVTHVSHKEEHDDHNGNAEEKRVEERATPSNKLGKNTKRCFIIYFIILINSKRKILLMKYLDAHFLMHS